MFCKRCKIIVIIVLALALAGAAAPSRTAAEAPPPQTGASLQDMRLPDLDGRLFELSKVKSGRVVVVFWAFWCDTWKKALPALLELHAMQQGASTARCSR